MSETEHSISDCFETIHGNLVALPDKYCYWRKVNSDGSKTPKTLFTDYRPSFSFIKDTELKKNLPELRMCLDYHRSIYELINPIGTFGWQHKLILCQLTASIYEGILYDLYIHRTSEGVSNKLCKVVIDDRNTRDIGFGYLLDKFSKAGFFKDKKWKQYLDDINHLRNTIHPKSLNSDMASFKTNKVIQQPISEIVDRLDLFIKLIQKVYI
jgi:hypothetical protein